MASANILVVEDNPTTANTMQLKLRSMGYDVPSIAKNYNEAIEQAGNQQPDLILMDIELGMTSESDGIDAATVIQELYDIPIIFVTSHSDDDILSRVKRVKPLGYINKPIRDKDLKTTLNLAFESRSQAGAVESDDSEFELVCDIKGKLVDNHVELQQRIKKLDLSKVEDLLPYNHYQITEYCTRINNSYLVAGRILDNIFSWEYFPDTKNNRVRVLCRNLTSNNSIVHDQTNEDALKQALNFIAIGVILVNKNYQPTFINQTAKQILDQGINLSLNGGQLELADDENNLQFKEMIDDHVHTCLKLRPQQPEQNLDIFVSPIVMAKHNSSDLAPVSILFLFNEQKDMKDLDNVLKALYNFTNAEAKLTSALMRDPRLEEAATSIGIKINTARTHLKKIFQKTGTDRQASLVHHIVSGPAGLILQSIEESE